ncbi:hypothetical protein [Clostridium magnum]|nr:hypothetical protein [Clostridium magnum]
MIFSFYSTLMIVYIEKLNKNNDIENSIISSVEMPEIISKPIIR